MNVVVAGKHPLPQWLSIDDAVTHCTMGIGVWDWASNVAAGHEPDLVIACCGDTPTLEALAATSILRAALPDLAIRVVNVVDLMRLQPCAEHPHGLSDDAYDALFTVAKPIIFAFHGYPGLVHQLTYHRTNRALSVHGYREEGTITTPFDIRVQNGLDRFTLVIDAIDHLPQTGDAGDRLQTGDARQAGRASPLYRSTWGGYARGQGLALGLIGGNPRWPRPENPDA